MHLDTMDYIVKENKPVVERSPREQELLGSIHGRVIPNTL